MHVITCAQSKKPEKQRKHWLVKAQKRSQQQVANKKYNELFQKQLKESRHMSPFNL